MADNLRSTGLVAAVVVALGLAAGGFGVGKGLERFRAADRSVTVKGLAEKDVESDYAVWPLGFRRAGTDFGAVQRLLAEDRDRVVAFLKTQGFTEAEIEIRPLQVQDLWAREYGGNNQPLRFQGTGQVLVKSARPKAVAAAALAVDPLIQAGLQLAGANDGAAGPQYQLRGFNEVKAPLLAEATRNAREQAEKFAAEAGATLGRLRNANQGVIQIGAGGDGNDDGSARVKRLRVVSTFEYTLD
ncbi:SIMPL domain-containing protein [Rubrivivax gelatinosus]|uniref:SIMPL domain-containing protein n=1 Tax=Rubrivivax gelatinosus TaxID=28068 RepID=UPI001908DD24|nr:SIMPL domain-containing protein [Rubrivivax gelatinosus]MBK1614014.1 SIMPL domain-containing protein [Rubrivivax gelatinosus]